MDMEMITNKVVNRLMEMLKEEGEMTRGIDEKKFLRSGGNVISIPGYNAVCLEDGKGINEVLSYDFFIIDKLSVEEMVSAADGSNINEKTRLLRQFLLNGKRVYINEAGLEYRMYKGISNTVYYNNFVEYEKKLQQYGICILNKAALENDLMSRFVKAKTENQDKTEVDTYVNYTSERKLITNELAMELAKEPAVVLKSGTIITPFAKDVFKENDTRIQFV
jgi:ethanolamine utilization protein